MASPAAASAPLDEGAADPALRTPLALLLAEHGAVAEAAELAELERWWEAEGREISAAVDRAGTPWLRMFDTAGQRVDEVLYPPEYWRMLRRGYRAGAVWRAFAEPSLAAAFRCGYLTAFYDPGLYCPYTVSLATALALEKYGDAPLRQRFLPPLLRRDDQVWQGATWMTEIGGGSDLGANVATRARRAGDHWRLDGDKYFTSNVHAELAVVAARPEGAPDGVRGLALFLVPRRRDDGRLNHGTRRLKDKIATRAVPTGEVELRDSVGHLLGAAEQGVYLILEVLNVSRVANSVASVALAQLAYADALRFAAQRRAFGRPVLEQPLLRRQFAARAGALRAAAALAWEAVRLLDAVRRELPPYSARYHLFRLVAHLAKYWTSELAVRSAQWAMEVHGGLGTLAEFGSERWLREAMILQIWEGTPHRQILDGLEVMERKRAHELLFAELQPQAEPAALARLRARIQAHLELPPAEREAGAEAAFYDLAAFTAATLRARDATHDPQHRP